jgi:hypothetical protein
MNATKKDITSIRVIYKDSKPNTWLRLADKIERSEAVEIMGAIKTNNNVMTCEAYTENGGLI